MDININKESDIPIYKQIIAQVLYYIQKNELKNGDKLPGERKLSEKLKTSRGTITKAYNELANMEVVTLIKGKGCFVLDEKGFLGLGRKDKAVLMINNNINNLVELGFSLSEIRIFSEIVLMEREQKYSAIRIGIIDCNREALHAVHCQIGTIKEISIRKHLLSEIQLLPIKAEIVEHDLIVTTHTHYEEVLAVLPEVEDKLIRVAMTPSKKTLVEIERISENRRIGILYNSDRFLRIIKKALLDASMEIKDGIALKISNDNREQIAAFIKNKEVIILPPLTFFDTGFRRFLMMRLTGKHMIEFNYLIERGNLLYLEEKIRSLMIRK